jgi:hypothetical protein
MRMTEEINSACDQGKLACWPERESLLPPYRYEDTPLVAKAFWGGLKFLTGFTVVPDSHKAAIARLDETTQERFRETMQDLEALFRPAHSRGTPEQLLLFRDMTRSRLAPIPNEAKPALPLQNRLNALKVQILQNISRFYQWITPVLVVLSLAAYLKSAINFFLAPPSFLFVLNTALFGAILAHLVMLAIVDSIFFPAILPRYFVPLYPVLYLFIGLALVDACCPRPGDTTVPSRESAEILESPSPASR